MLSPLVLHVLILQETHEVEQLDEATSAGPTVIQNLFGLTVTCLKVADFRPRHPYRL